MKDVEVNVLDYLLKEIPKHLRYESIKGFFSGLDNNIEFQVNDQDFVNKLEKAAEYGLWEDRVHIEIQTRLYNYVGFVLTTKYSKDDDVSDAYFYVDESGKIYDIDYD